MGDYIFKVPLVIERWGQPVHGVISTDYGNTLWIDIDETSVTIKDWDAENIAKLTQFLVNRQDARLPSYILKLDPSQFWLGVAISDCQRLLGYFAEDVIRYMVKIQEMYPTSSVEYSRWFLRTNPTLRDYTDYVAHYACSLASQSMIQAPNAEWKIVPFE